MTKSNMSDAMKQGMRRLPSGVSVLTAESDQQERMAMTVSSVTSVSDKPPSLLVCVNHSSRICPVLAKDAAFAINVLGQSHQAISIACSSGDLSDQRFQQGQWDFSAGGAPALKDAEAVFQCKVSAVHAFGTHNVVIGEIVAVQTGAQSVPDPLIYLDGTYREIE